MMSSPGGEKALRHYNSANVAQNKKTLQRHEYFSQTKRLKPYVETCDTHFNVNQKVPPYLSLRSARFSGFSAPTGIDKSRNIAGLFRSSVSEV